LRTGHERIQPSFRLERLTRRAGIDFDRAAAAYHEAAHAMAGLWYGWVIDRGGVEIDERQRCCFSCRAYTYTPEARAVVAMAGWLSEHKWHLQGSSDWNDKLIQILDSHDWGRVHVVGDDHEEVVNALVGRRFASDIATPEFLLAVETIRERTAALIARPAVWRAIRQVARALLANGKLSDVEVIRTIGEDDFLQVDHGRWTAEPSLPDAVRRSTG
jgi:hypothetical protein